MPSHNSSQTRVVGVAGAAVGRAVVLADRADEDLAAMDLATNSCEEVFRALWERIGRSEGVACRQD